MKMASKNSGMPADTKANAKQVLNQVKMEAAQEVGVDLKQGYNGDLTSRQAGSIGGQMVNNICPVRTKKFVRPDWKLPAQQGEREYRYSLVI